MDCSDKDVKIIQISDSHLFDSAEKTLIGVNTDSSLRAVVSLIANETDISAILATGDLSQDCSLKSYRRFADILSDINLPLYWLPGNHDEADFFHTPPENFPLPARSIVEVGNWRIIMLDSVIPGDEAGHLASSELEYIEKNALEDGKHTMLVLHHQPIPCGSAWLDTMQLDNSDEFLQLISSKPSIRAVVHGHIHQESQQEIGGIQFICTPSTCFQFSPKTDEFSLDDRLPGYRTFTLMRDGRIETKVTRLTDYHLHLETAVEGY